MFAGKQLEIGAPRHTTIFIQNFNDNRCRLHPGQAREITRVAAAHPWLVDDAFVARHLDRWLA